MNKIEAPDPRDFEECVEECMRGHEIADCVYRRCIKEFKNLLISELDEGHESRITAPFLLVWGNMSRVLGYRGVAAVRKKTRRIARRVEHLRQEKLLSASLDDIGDRVVRLSDEVRQTIFRSKNGKEGSVGSTPASKILHLACPDLFVMWDSSTRAMARITSSSSR